MTSIFVVQACRRLRQFDQEGDADPLLGRALFNAALIAYARCWATGVRVELPDALLDELPGDGRGFHDYLIRLRGKHIAHSVNPFEDVAIGLIIVPGDREEPTAIAVGHLLAKLVGFPAEALQHFEILAAFLLEEVGKLYAIQAEVVRSEAASVEVDALLALPEMRLVVPGPADATVSKARRAEAREQETQADS
jgi:hypothetical protein